MSVAISLGYNCNTSRFCVDNHLRPRKADGYNTCPFDLCITPYEGLVQCISDKFKYFTDTNYLRLQNVPANILNSEQDEELVYNTKYGFVFLHESPGHANLYMTEQWANGKYHFTENNFSEFCKRYNRRIESFHKYLMSNNEITFVIGCPHVNLTYLHDAIRKSYPTLRYKIMRFRVDNEHYFQCASYAAHRS